jgi:hypothetical protein
MTDYPDENTQEEYSDTEEYQDNVLDEQREMWEEQTGGNYPAARKPESLFSLFKSVWRTNDSTKIANLDKTELGDLGISVRDAQNISSFAGFLGHKGVKEYFAKSAEITLSTSMSKKGWFPELFVTSRKFAHKGNIGNLQGTSQQKWRIFGKQQQSEQQPEE